MDDSGNILGRHEVVAGFLCSALILGGFLFWASLGMMWFLIAPFLIVLGFLLLIDDMTPIGRQPYMACLSLSFVAGCAVTVISFFNGFMGWIIIIALVLAAARILSRFSGKSRGRRARLIKLGSVK